MSFLIYTGTDTVKNHPWIPDNVNVIESDIELPEKQRKQKEDNADKVDQ